MYSDYAEQVGGKQRLASVKDLDPNSVTSYPALLRCSFEILRLKPQDDSSEYPDPSLTAFVQDDSRESRMTAEGQNKKNSRT